MERLFDYTCPECLFKGYCSLHLVWFSSFVGVTDTVIDNDSDNKYANCKISLPYFECRDSIANWHTQQKQYNINFLYFEL